MRDSRIREERPVATSTRSALRTGWIDLACRALHAGLVVLMAGSWRDAAAQPPTQPDAARLRGIVERLASPDFGGRSGAAAQKSVEFLTAQFRELELAPLFGGKFIQTIPGKDPGTIQGRNVGALLRGSDARLRDEWIIVAAHFDHLGVRRGVLYPGADDNASGVAMMLEVARCVARGEQKPRRSIMFVGFDLEEVGLFGSRYFIAHPPVPLERIALFVTADMIARSIAGIGGSYVFVMGTENAPAVRPWVVAAGKRQPLKIGLLGADLLVLNRSDYGPFRTKGIPFLFFTTGENPHYHRPSDVAETLDYPKLTAISRMIFEVVLQAIEAPTAPRWQNLADNPFAEAETIRAVLALFVKHADELKIGAPQLYLINNTLAMLDGVVARGTINPDERARVIQAARLVLFTVL